ncbi:MAG: dienelactone hydrolase family protein [Candidatus Acidoferrales bacterium]
MKRCRALVFLLPLAGAGHAFVHLTRPSYREAAAQDAWQKTLEFLACHLKE